MADILYVPLASEHTPENIPHIASVGGKAAGLYWLAVHGFPVPPTWTLTTDIFDMAVQQSGAAQSVAKIWQRMRALDQDWHAVQQALTELEPERRRAVELLRRVSQFRLVADALLELPPVSTHWAVRSSATVEDNPEYSFAGQFHSSLSVLRYAIWDAVREVWASTFSQHVLAYCVQNATPLPRMAVAMQPMAPITARDRSGVAFSHSPVESMPGVLIQAAFGTAQVVVEGYGGDIYTVQDDDTVQIQRVPLPHINITGGEGRITQAPSPSDLPLTEDEARTLAQLARDIQHLWETPVDIEFIWREGQEPLVVQVRTATGR